MEGILGGGSGLNLLVLLPGADTRDVRMDGERGDRSPPVLECLSASLVVSSIRAERRSGVEALLFLESGDKRPPGLMDDALAPPLRGPTKGAALKGDEGALLSLSDR